MHDSGFSFNMNDYQQEFYTMTTFLGRINYENLFYQLPQNLLQLQQQLQFTVLRLRTLRVTIYYSCRGFISEQKGLTNMREKIIYCQKIQASVEQKQKVSKNYSAKLDMRKQTNKLDHFDRNQQK